jgi:hypothetical protein
MTERALNTLTQELYTEAYIENPTETTKTCANVSRVVAPDLLLSGRRTKLCSSLFDSESHHKLESGRTHC